MTKRKKRAKRKPFGQNMPYSAVLGDSRNSCSPEQMVAASKGAKRYPVCGAGVRLTDSERLTLAREVWEAVYASFESFEEDNVGANLAYLLGAITSRAGETCEFWTDTRGKLDPDKAAFIAALRRKFPKDDLVWKFIEIQ